MLAAYLFAFRLAFERRRILSKAARDSLFKSLLCFVRFQSTHQNTLTPIVLRVHPILRLTSPARSTAVSGSCQG